MVRICLLSSKKTHRIQSRNCVVLQGGQLLWEPFGYMSVFSLKKQPWLKASNHQRNQTGVRGLQTQLTLMRLPVQTVTAGCNGDGPGLELVKCKTTLPWRWVYTSLLKIKRFHYFRTAADGSSPGNASSASASGTEKPFSLGFFYFTFDWFRQLLTKLFYIMKIFQHALNRLKFSQNILHKETGECLCF